jgi:hypothetical protein
MKNPWHAMNKSPWAWASVFALVDLLWLLSLHAIGWIRTTGSGELFGTAFDFANSAMRMWNTVHYPVRQLIEPVLFPLVNAHSSYPSSLIFHIYEAICILQSVLIGYLLGLVYIRLINKRRRSGEASS